MKNRATILILSTFVSLAALGQGTINFANFDAASGLNSPVFLSDGTTRAYGPYYVAALLAGPSPTNLQEIATTPLLSGDQAGYFSGGVQSISTVPGGSNAFVVIEVWRTNYSSFQDAFVAGQTGSGNVYGWSKQGVPFPIVTGDGDTIPPGVLTLLFPYPIGLNSVFMDARAVIFQKYDPGKGTVTISFTGTLQSSTDLVHWTNVDGAASPQTFPENKAKQYFRTFSPWN